MTKKEAVGTFIQVEAEAAGCIAPWGGQEIERPEEEGSQQSRRDGDCGPEAATHQHGSNWLSGSIICKAKTLPSHNIHSITYYYGGA